MQQRDRPQLLCITDYNSNLSSASLADILKVPEEKIHLLTTHTQHTYLNSEHLPVYLSNSLTIRQKHENFHGRILCSI